MARPTKLTHEMQQKIGDNVALWLSYVLAAKVAGITYKTFNDWLKNTTFGIRKSQLLYFENTV